MPKKNEVILAPMFWDCECKVDYIKHESQGWCGKCTTHRIEQPESRLSEVLKMIAGDCGVEIHVTISR